MKIFDDQDGFREMHQIQMEKRRTIGAGTNPANRPENLYFLTPFC